MQKQALIYSFQINASRERPHWFAAKYANRIGWHQFENSSSFGWYGIIESHRIVLMVLIIFVFENEIYEKELNDKNWILKIFEIFRKIAFWKSMNFILLLSKTSRNNILYVTVSFLWHFLHLFAVTIETVTSFFQTTVVPKYTRSCPKWTRPMIHVWKILNTKQRNVLDEELHVRQDTSLYLCTSN